MNATRTRLDTPWGNADHVEPLGEDGMLAVSTPSHGGIFVPKELLSLIPKKDREYAKRWSGSEQWYEEDCAWAAVAVRFPSLFSADNLALAQRIYKEYVK